MKPFVLWEFPRCLSPKAFSFLFAKGFRVKGCNYQLSSSSISRRRSSSSGGSSSRRRGGGSSRLVVQVVVGSSLGFACYLAQNSQTPARSLACFLYLDVMGLSSLQV